MPVGISVLKTGRYHLASLRARLWLLAGLPLFALPILFALLFFVGDYYFQRVLAEKIAGDLETARGYLVHVQKETRSSVSSLADSSRLRMLLRSHADGAGLEAPLVSRQESVGFDFLALVDTRGKLLAASYPDGGGGRGLCRPESAASQSGCRTGRGGVGGARARGAGGFVANLVGAGGDDAD